MIKGLVDIQRRAVIKKTLSASTLAMVAASDLLLPQRVLAHWPTDAFSAETVEDVLLALLGQADVAVGQMLNFSVGKPAKHIVDGQSVSVEIDSELEDIERLVILVDNNPFPLVMSLDFTRDVLLPLKTRVKIVDGESQLMVVVRSGGQLYKTVQTLRVDISGNP